jgi:hypothetical protein
MAYKPVSRRFKTTSFLYSYDKIIRLRFLDLSLINIKGTVHSINIWLHLGIKLSCVCFKNKVTCACNNHKFNEKGRFDYIHLYIFDTKKTE